MGEMQKVPEFNSSEEEEEVSSVRSSEPIVKKRGKAKIWVKEKTFEDFASAEDAVKSEDQWTFGWSHRGIEGRKITYLCSKGGRSEKSRNSCPSSLYLLLHAENLQVTLFRSDDDHKNHKDGCGIPKDVKSQILQLYEDGVKRPKAIIEALRGRGTVEPTLKQTTNFLAAKRREKFGSATISSSDLIKWCEERKEIPEDEDQPFAVSYCIAVADVDTDEELQLFISTKRLLGLASRSFLIQTDATYKLNWQGYPVLLVGTSDAARQFHPYGLAVCYGESEKDFAFIFRSLKMGVEKVHGVTLRPTVLMADASDAISNGFQNVFGEATRLMCYFHVIKNVDTKLRAVEAKLRNAIRTDIALLQICTSSEEFNAATLLFLSKWRNVESPGNELVAPFINYFENTWLKRHCNWYEGACIRAPSTNNALEATNAVIKKEYTFRERLPLGQFLHCVENKLLRQWSTARDETKPNNKQFESEPPIELALWTQSYQWAKSNLQVISEIHESQNIYYIPSSDFLKTNKPFEALIVTSVKSRWLLWETFSEYQECREAFWTVKMNGAEWKSATCNCRASLKHEICKHVVGLAIRLKITMAPLEATDVPLGQKRKRGRPSKAKAALVRE